jgi:hypothetical protein
MGVFWIEKKGRIDDVRLSNATAEMETYGK